MRKPPDSLEDQLRTLVQDHYDLLLVTLTFLPLGLDCNAVYRVNSAPGTVSFLKATPVPLYIGPRSTSS